MRTGPSDFPHRFRDLAFLRSMLGERVLKGRELANFTESYWSNPVAALNEICQAGFEVVTYASAEGFAGGLRPVVEQLFANHPDVVDNGVQAAAETSELPQYRDNGDHLHVVVRKRNGIHNHSG